MDFYGEHTLYRATGRGKHKRVGKWSWWAVDEDDARAYMDNPGFGGPFLYSGVFDTTRTLDLVGIDDPWSWKNTDGIERLSWELFPNDEDAQLAFQEDNSESWCHYVIDYLEEGLKRKLRKMYDWVSIIDSFPENARTMCFLKGPSREERKSIELIEYMEVD